MGFDIHGIKPIINKEYSQEYKNIMNKYGKDGFLDWSMDISEFTKKRYFELQDEFRENNPGDYFRNNVWYWRPLWDFVCNTCNDFLSKDDMSKGENNDNRRIFKTKANKIAKRLSKLIADGTVDSLERKIALEIARAEEYNKSVREEMKKITDACHEKHGKNLVPANYPEPYQTQWNKAYDKKDWTSSYPFHAENVKAFAAFCQQSGGFTIG